MTVLSQAIRSIRRRLGKTMVEFAEMIGCKQSTVSRYESGKLIPGRSVLILLLQLAKGSEKQPILGALEVNRPSARGWEEAELIDALKTFEEYLEVRSTKPRATELSSSSTLVAFVKAAKRIVLQGSEIDQGLVAILEHWVAHHADRKTHQFFRDAAAYLDVELTVLATRRAKRISR